MNKNIKRLEPQRLWNNFCNLNEIPRPSKKEEKIRQFMVKFGKSLGLETLVDKVGNVIIKKPASQGMENRKTVVLQSHLDMVCQKNNDTQFNFDTQGIKMLVKDDWVSADGTTLGADNGIGVAAIMSILESHDIAHPTLEALLTIDEETGMTGAMGLEAGYLQGEILLNLDTEDDNEIGVGCAGGIDISARKTYKLEKVSSKMVALKLTVKGLRGGHSGMDIHHGYGNANKLMNRVLFALNDEVLIAEIDGGSLRNAIPRESNVVVVCHKVDKVKNIFKKIQKDIVNEYLGLEGNIELFYTIVDTPKKSMSADDQTALIKSVYAIHNGVYRMSPDIENLVETSNSLARIELKNGHIKMESLTRSSVDSGKMDLANTIKCGLELGGFDVVLSGSYPGWKPNPDSAILKVLKNTYQDIFAKKPGVLACHAGLECGILGSNYPTMDMISFGPNIRGAHSPDEKVSISSVQKFWKYLLAILKNSP